MNSATADIREMTHEEISDVNGGTGIEVLTGALILTCAFFGLKFGYDAGRDCALNRNRHDEKTHCLDPKK